MKNISYANIKAGLIGSIVTSLAILTLFAGTRCVHADEVLVGVPVAAYHIGAPDQKNYLGKPYNDTQYKSFGFSLEYVHDWKVNDGLLNAGYVGAELGTFENSWFQRSKFVVVDLGDHVTKHLDLGLDVGVINGYGKQPSLYGPAITPYARVNFGHTWVSVNYLQTLIAQGKSALAFNVGVSF